ncbi:MAG: arginine decarboxylase, partial [Lachnospira sp.]|nr:arginine decarboxylase [Lachnospira sp.]
AGAGICFYPPGIPLVNPGEEITKEVIAVMREGIDSGLEVIGADIIKTYTATEKSEEGVYVTCLE